MRTDASVPLGHYLDSHPGVGVQLNCESCGRHENLPMDGVVRRLTALGIDARLFGIRDVASLVEKPCVCGALKWTSDRTSLRTGDRRRRKTPSPCDGARRPH